MRSVRYRPDGNAEAWRAAVTGSALAVLPPAVTPHAVEGVWRRLDGGGIGAVLESLTGAFGTSLAAIPPFGLAVAEGDGVRVAVRGPVTLVVETADGVDAISGDGVATWTERFLAGVVRVSVDLGTGTDADMLPIESGVVPAAEVVFDLAGGDTPTPVAAAAPAVSAPAAEPERALEPEPALEPVPEPEPVAEPEPVLEPEPEPAVKPAPAAEPEPAAEAASSPEVESPADLGETIASPRTRAKEPASELAPEPATPGLVTGVPPLHTLGGSPVSTPGGSAPHSAATPSETVSGIDDDPELGATVASPRTAAKGTTAVPALPPFVPPVPPLPPDVAGAAQLGDHDGATVSVAEARAMRAASTSYDSIEDVPPRSPSRGRIRLADGRVVELERTVIIGRRPRSTRPAENDLPTLVAVDGPQHDISRNHVEIRAEGEHVLAVDLASTNGTVLLRGGHDPVRLHPNEPTMVIDADVLDLGDGVTLTFEDLP
ncbi:FHA domain-containing protein [Microbacterium sp. LKL04]|uniref:FHA domain-containing protein n=1 Tax=Microbacterium sp. LKL04 TaxID=912630 RepID=UPI000875D86E|nr:FHA domain-containing protein [Microbacterium sp. LKL04]SCY63108.1 FHA domain-containing protein [Microbacterium sp. LKL04]